MNGTVLLEESVNRDGRLHSVRLSKKQMVK